VFVKINKNIFKTKVLIDKKSQAIGMMGKTFDESFDALLFLLGGKSQSFWMKNCITPLDIIIIKNNTINKIHHDCLPCEEEPCPKFRGEGNIVLEIEGGLCDELEIEEGDFVEYIF